MVLSILMVLVTAAVATVELVLLHQRRRVFLGRDQPRDRRFERGQQGAAHQLYLRLRSHLWALWTIARTAPFTAEPVPGVAGQASGSAAAEPLDVPSSLPAAAEGSPPQIGGRTLKRHAARNVLHWIRIAEESELRSYRSLADAATAAAALPSGQPWGAPARAETAWNASSSTVAALPPTPAGEGIVYVDASGRMTFANAAARTLLDWNSGDRALSDVLAGGTQESAALLEAVARHELIEREVTLLNGPSPTRLEISALALRDRDGNLWGAALFIRRSPAARQASTITSA